MVKKNLPKKVCVVTGTRAEFGLLRWVIYNISKSSVLDLQLIATGTHLSPEFGLTVKDIEAHKIKVDYKVEMLMSSDTSIGIAKSVGIGMIGFADAFAQLKPNLIIVLGDRYEIFAAVTAAMIARIPVAHLHGGELTEGVIDESIRHSITKMSHLHFVAAEEYRQRVIQLGEDPSRVFKVGGLGIDNIKRLNLYTRKELEESLNIKLQRRNLLITFHPVTLEHSTSSNQIDELLAALGEFYDYGLIFTMPNADTDSRIIVDKIIEFCTDRGNAHFYNSLGQIRYLSAIHHVDAVVGNSSSGLLEVPSFNKPTINIGDRQRGRLKADSIIDCQPVKGSIYKAIQTAFTTSFQERLKQTVSPYGNGGASDSIIKIIENIELENIGKKTFYDIPSISSK